MRLARVKIENFRSIAETCLEDCGNLNVLIGKNNSGKSNILSAIQKFFDFFTGDEGIATTVSPIRNTTDWHVKSDPVRITLALDFNAGEVEELRESISQETPQVKNALSNLTGGACVEFELTFMLEPSCVGFISRIWLINLDGRNGSNETTIFRLSVEAALEIALRQKNSRQFRNQITAFETFVDSFDEDDFRLLRDRAAPVSSYLRRYGASVDAAGQIRRAIRDAASAEEVKQRISALKVDLQDQISSLEAAENKAPITTFSGESSTIPDYVLRLAEKIAGLRVHYLSEQRKPIGQAEASKILSLKMSRGQIKVLNEIQKSVQELLGVRIDAFASDQQAPVKTPGQSGLSAELDVDDFLVQVNGSGIREALRLMLDFEFTRPDIMLVEEPEVHLHPALEITMMQYLKRISSKCQIILTTHSTNFLDTADLRNVYLVTKGDSTLSNLIDVEEAEQAIPQELGIRLSSLFMYDRLAFIEGPSDEQILRVFADTLGINLSQGAVGFVTTGGARNFTHYASASTLSFLSKRRVKLIFLLDRDERDASEIDQLSSKLSGFGELIVLNRREIENYLIAPGALTRYINNHPTRARLGVEVSIEEVTREIESACEGLLDVAIERRVLRLVCRPFIPDRRTVIDRVDASFSEALSSELDGVLEKITQAKVDTSAIVEAVSLEVKEGWARNKLGMVPGEELLKAVLRRFEIGYNKRKDGPRLAAEMKPDEIPMELKDILKHLAR